MNLELQKSSKRKKSESNIIRIGDEIQIKEPHMFVRCGYPKTIESERAVVEEEHKGKIAEFLASMGVKGSEFLHNTDRNYQKVYDRILNEICHIRLKQNGFGGRERKVYTEFDPSLKDKRFFVDHITYVKTGTYQPASVTSSYWDGYDYEPAYLCGMKTHKILHCSNRFDDLKIEAIHVEKVIYEEDIC